MTDTTEEAILKLLLDRPRKPEDNWIRGGRPKLDFSTLSPEDQAFFRAMADATSPASENYSGDDFWTPENVARLEVLFPGQKAIEHD